MHAASFALLRARRTRLLYAIVPLVVVLAGCGGRDSGTKNFAGPQDLPQGSEPVSLDASSFIRRIDNPYWPLLPGSRWVYSETDTDGSTQRVEVTVQAQTKKILGIGATVVHDVVTEDGRVTEDTYDWYGQDERGNVWYLGEDTKEYEEGKPASTEGSWEAGVDGAQPGIVMPARPRPGMAYRQEYLKGEAEDRARILSVDERAEVPYGSFAHAVKTAETTPLEPDVLEHKYYAKGVGVVLTVAKGGGREELLSFRRGR